MPLAPRVIWGQLDPGRTAGESEWDSRAGPIRSIVKPTGPGRPIVSMVIDGFESVFQISISSQNLHGSACCAAAVATRRRTA